MAYTPKKVQYFKRGESSWELFYFETSADQIAASATKQVSTKAQLNLIDTYLRDFNNEAGQLVRLDENAKIQIGLLPDISAIYLTEHEPTFTGTLQGVEAKLTTIQAYDNKDASITLEDEDIILEGAGRLEVNTADGIYLEHGDIDMSQGKIKNLATPEQQTDAANKEYVDNKVSSGFTTREPVTAASIENVYITAVLNSLDGIDLNANDRVLLKNQETASENGVYVLNESKIPQILENDSALGSAVFVEKGSSNNDYIYHHSSENSWVAFSKPDTVKAGNGLIKSGTTLNVATIGITNAMLAGNIDSDKIKSFKIDDNAGGWSTMPGGSTDEKIGTYFNALATAIKLLRGTPKFNSDVIENIAGAYSNAAAAQTAANNAMAAIPTITVGKTLPTSGMKDGDLFFLEK